MALNNLDRFVGQARNPLSIGTLFERDPAALPTLLQIFSTSQHFSDLLVADPEGFDLLRLTEGAAGRPADAGRGPRRGNRRAGTRASGAALAAAVQTPRDAADRLRRHRPRAEPADGHRADLLPGRRHPGRRPCAPPGESSATQRGDPIGPDGRAARFVDAGHGQARRLRVELFQRHRPDLPLRRRRQDRRPAAGEQPGVLRPSRPRSRAAADRKHRAGHRLSRRSAAAARRAARADGDGLARRCSATTTSAAGPGSGRPTSRPGRWPATSTWANEFLAQLDALDLSPLPEPGRHQRHQGPEAADRAADLTATAPTPAT